MKNIIRLIREHEFTEAEDQIDNTVPLIMEKKLLEMKKAVAAKMSEQMITASKKLRRGLTENGKESSEDEEDSEEKLDEKRGLWDNIHKKRKRIESGSGERMRKPGSEGAPSEKDLRNSQTEEALEEDTNKESPKKILSKRADVYDRTEVPKASYAKAVLQTDYGSDSSIGKKAQTAYDSVIAKRDKLEKDAHDARVAQDKDDESSRVKNKLSDYAKGGYLTKDAAEKHIYRAKSNIQGGEYAKRRVSQSEPINEEELDEARISIVKARIRGGKIQRRKRVSNVPGMTLRGGTLKRMSAAERRRRKMGARRGKVKRRAKLSRSLMKRKRSLQKRKSLGL